VFPGDPRASGTWSGTPSGILAGVGAAGGRALPVNATLPRWLDRPLIASVALSGLPRAAAGGLGPTLRRSLRVARNTPAMSCSYGLAARRRLGAAGEFDAIVQIGTGYRLSASVPLITFEDMTIRQALDCGYPEFAALTSRQQRRRLELQRSVYEQATICALATPWAARSVVEDYGIAPEKVYVAWIGANHCVDPPPSRDWSQPRFLFVGREWERKNGPMVVRAFARVKEQLPGARLDVVGGHPPLAAPGVHGHGVLRLDRPHERAAIEDLYRAATCFVMPSQREPAGIVYAEAMRAGLPCIGTSSGGAKDLIGDAGTAIDPTDDDALVAAMTAYADPGRAETLSSAACARSRLFSWEAVATRLLRAIGLL
jgi:glycosyltransferase involved in cell wall biosynthesis